MADWNPSLYLQFDAERTRPRPTCSRVLPICRSSTPSTSAAGRETAPACYAPRPLATIVGIDNSPAMLVRAAQALPDCEFIDADIARWRPAQPPDVIYANASLQWLTDHETLFPIW